MSDKKQKILDVLTRNYNISLFSAQGREMIAGKLVNALIDENGDKIEDNFTNPIQKSRKPSGDRPVVKSPVDVEKDFDKKGKVEEVVKIDSESLKKIMNKGNVRTEKHTDSNQKSKKPKPKKSRKPLSKPPSSTRGFKNLKNRS